MERNKRRIIQRLNTPDPLSRQGFTLVEMLLVVVLMGIMLGSIVPSFKPFLEGQTLKNASQTLSNVIRYTRSLAVERSAVTQLIFDKDTGGFAVMIESDPINLAGTFVPVTLPVKYPKQYQEKVTIASILKQTLSGSQQENTISFQPDGTTSDTFIYMTDRYEDTNTIGIIGLTGQVLVWNHAAQTFYE